MSFFRDRTGRFSKQYNSGEAPTLNASHDHPSQGPISQDNEYAAPLGPLQYAPPPEPPPGHTQYEPPPGPPPWQAESTLPSRPLSEQQNYSPTTERLTDSLENTALLKPCPSRNNVNHEPPPYHDWTVVPDTASLPPPPSLRHETSPTNNASLDDADRAHNWCKQNPLVKPHWPTQEQRADVEHGRVHFLRPKEYHGDLRMPGIGTWKGSTRPGSNDSCLITSCPLYFACSDSPWRTQRKKTIYFEIHIRSLSGKSSSYDSSIALGYCAMPYPTWRLPGWERGSLAVHGDDGRRYVNDTWGGKDFTSAFCIGDTLGLGMSFSVPDSPPDYETLPNARSKLNIHVFFTRNGRMEGGWDLHEELDAVKDMGVEGLDGQFDLSGAVGTFGSIEFDCHFNRQDWLWLPR